MKHFLAKILIGLALVTAPFSVQAARTDALWDYIQGGNYTKPNGSPSGTNLLIYGSDKYVNFGVVTGTNGYGFRDNSGTIQWKNSGGSWQNIGTGGTGGAQTPWTSDIDGAGFTLSNAYLTATATTLDLSGVTNSLVYANGIGRLGAIATTSLGLPTFSDLSSYLTLASWYATTTDGLDEGLTNLYYTNPRVQTYLDTLSKGYFYSTTSADAWANTSAINIYSLGGILDATMFPGADIGAKINAAYAALPSYGGTITVPNGVYPYSTSIAFTTAGKEALLKCSPGKSTVLNYTGTGVAITIDANSGIGHNVGYGIDGCHFTGTSGNITTTTGLVTGGTNGAEGIVIQNSVFEIFGKAIELKNKTWLASFKTDFFTNNVMALYTATSSLTNFGENIQFDHVTFGADTQTNAVNCIQINRGGFNDFHFINSSFDNCQIAITDTAGISTNNIRITDSHFENPSAAKTPYDFITVARNQNTEVVLSGVTFLQDSPTIVPAQYITNGGKMTMINVSAQKLFSATTTTNFVTLLNPNDVVRSIGFTYGPSAVASFYNNEGLSSSAMQFMNATTTGQKISLVSNGLSATSTIVMGKGLNHTTRSEIQYDSYNGIFSLNNVYNGLLKLKTNDTDRLTITGSGDVGIGSINPSSKLQVDGIVTAQSYSATTTSATSTFLGSVQIGGSSGTNVLKISDTGIPYTPSASNSVGGIVNITQSGLGAGMVMYTNLGATANGGLMWLRCDNVAYTKDCASISNDGTAAGLAIASTNGAALNISNSGNTEHTAVISYTGTSSTKGALSVSNTNQLSSAATISGYQLTGGTLNLTHTGGQPSDANAAALSISLVSTSTGSLAQGIFMDSSGSATGGKLLNLRNGGIEYFTLLGTGNLGIGTTSPYAKLSVQGKSGQYSDIFSVASSSLATLFNVNYKGYVGIGSSTPWGILSIIDSNVDRQPGIVMATSSGATVFWGATASTSDALGDPVRMLVGWGTKFLSNFDTFAQLSVNGEINTNNTIALECKAEGMKKTAQNTGDLTGSVISTTLGYPCGDFSYIEDAAGVADFVAGKTGNYIRLRTGAAGTIAAAGDGMGMALTTAGLYTATNTPLKLEVSARPVVNNATSTLYLLGFFNTTGVSANYAAMPTDGCGFVASTTQANWIIFCAKASAYTYLDSGIASTTNIATPSNGSFTRFRVEMGNTYATFRYLRGSVGDTNSWVTIGSISTNYPNTAALNPTVAVGGVTAKLSDELQVRFIRAWYNDPEPY